MNNVQNSFQSEIAVTVMMTAENNNFKLSKLTIGVWTRERERPKKVNAYEKIDDK